MHNNLLINLTEKSFYLRLIKFQHLAFSPGLHCAFAVLWSFSLLASFYLVSNTVNFVFASYLFVAPFTVYCVLFYLRAADEIKDCDYDKTFNPGRPLASGVFSLSEIWGFMLLLGFVSILVNYYSGIAKLIVIFDLLYALLLIFFERLMPFITKKIFINLLVTYPVNIALSVYLLFIFQEVTELSLQIEHWYIIVAFALAFLHFEFGRKTAWQQHSKPHENLYSNAVGPHASIVICWHAAILSVGVYFYATRPWELLGLLQISGWLPLLSVWPATTLLITFYRHKNQRIDLKTPSMKFLIGFYISILMHFVIKNLHGLSSSL